jgi:radical SAM protein with 4Fe4S-binding SPASM domain
MIQLQKIDAQKNVFTLQELRVELLRNCPLLCVHCSAYAAPHHSLLLPLQRVLQLIDEFAGGGGCRVTFTGGEPLMYTGIETVLQRCREHQLVTRLFSSGVIFDGTQRVPGYSILEQCRQLLNVAMYSVYSTSPEAHDQITRIPGSFQLTSDAIKYTIQLGIGAEIHFVPTLMNYQEFPDVVAMAARLSVPRVGILRFVPHGRGKAKADSLALGGKEHTWLRNSIVELRQCYPHITIDVGSAYNLLNVGTPRPCTAGINQLVIEADGAIVPCSAFSNFHMQDEIGNILQHSLQDVWKGSLYLQKVRQALGGIHNCDGCLAQKTVIAGRIDPQGQDPLEKLCY